VPQAESGEQCESKMRIRLLDEENEVLRRTAAYPGRDVNESR
jgi:hypothetical protein